MTKKILITVAAVVVVLLLIELIALLRLKASISSYAAYWKQHNAQASGELTYVALGDSAAQGVGASKPQNGYVALIADRIAQKTGKKVKLINLSVSGAKIDDVIDKQLPQLANYKPDVVTIEIGGNDVAGKYVSKDFQERYERLASQLPAGTYVADMPFFNGRIRHNPQALDAGKQIVSAAEKHSLVVVELQKLTQERDSLKTYASDYFHPSNTGYRNWADAFWMKIEPNL